MSLSTAKINAPDENLAAERLQTLYTVHDMLKQVEAEGLNISVILPQVLKIAARQLDASDGSIIIVSRTHEIEHVWFAQGSPTEEFMGTIMSEGLAGRVIRNQAPYVIHDTRQDEHWLPRPGHVTTSEPWSVICTPFITRRRAIGAITIHKPGADQFDDEDLSLLTAISNLATSTIENARLFEQSQRQLKASALLYTASNVINSSLDIGEVMQLLLTQMNELLHAEAISIALVDRQSNELVYRVAEGAGSAQIVDMRLPSNQGISGWVMEHNEPVLVTDTHEDQRFFSQGDKLTGHETKAMICAPMQSKGQVLGTIQAINPTKGNFSADDLELLVNLANIASIALANAQQFARTQAAEARYMNLFQDSIDAIVLTNLTGDVVEANRHALEFFGYGRTELLTKHIQDLHPAGTVLPEAVDITDDEIKRLQSKAITNLQRSIHVEVYVKRTMIAETELLQWIHHDISQQVELEEMRQDLTAMLFHDLQSPLGNVISSLELMRYEITDSLLLSMLDIASRSSQRLQTLVRSLLDINQLEAGHPIRSLQDVEVESLFDYVWEVQEPNFDRRGIDFRREITADLPPVYVDEDMIRRVLINLVDNAIKHSHNSQSITVIARFATNPSDNGNLVLSVQDEGVGIPEEYRTSIFEKFQRIKARSSSKGLGLGLAFCRLAVEAHGGRIWADEAPGGGARINLTLPPAPPL